VSRSEFAPSPPGLDSPRLHYRRPPSTRGLNQERRGVHTLGAIGASGRSAPLHEKSIRLL